MRHHFIRPSSDSHIGRHRNDIDSQTREKDYREELIDTIEKEVGTMSDFPYFEIKTEYLEMLAHALEALEKGYRRSHKRKIWE
jgi:hypothetical protein